MRGINARPGAQQGLPPRAPRRCAAAPCINQAIAGTEPHDLSKLVASIGKVTLRAERARAAARRTDRQLQHVLRGVRRAVGERCEPPSPNCRATARDRRAASSALDASFAADADVRARHPPGRASRPPRPSPRCCRGSHRSRRRSRRASSAASPRAWRAAMPSLAQLEGRTGAALPARPNCSTSA